MTSFLQTIHAESRRTPKPPPIIAVERRLANRPLSQEVLAGVIEEAASVIAEIRDFLAG